jgi:UMF1 family MFS transporter
MKTQRSVAAWCLYDWSATPFHSVINTFVFSVWFARRVYGDETSGSAAWAYAAGLAGLAVALLSPVCGAIADRTGRRKPWIAALTLLNLSACGLLWFVLPEKTSADLALTLMVVATIGGELALVFYNAMLPDLAPPEKLGRLSGFGWGCGYLGGLAALGLVLAGLVLPDTPWFGIGTADGANMPERQGPHIPWGDAVRQGLAQLKATLATLGRHRAIVRFLIASALYRDGLNTLFAVGGLYAAHSFGMSQSEVLIFAIGIEITAVLGCFAFGWLDDRMGAKASIMVALAGILVTGTMLLILHQKAWFMPVALIMGLFIGPAQSSGRSLMARLAPREIVTEMFGLYQFAGKSVSFLGPIAFATATTLFDSQRCGMATVLLFILAGLFLMRKIEATQ